MPQRARDKVTYIQIITNANKYNYLISQRVRAPLRSSLFSFSAGQVRLIVKTIYFSSFS